MKLTPFKEFIKEEIITPSTEPGTMSFWHGGDLESPYDELKKQKVVRGQFGFGLYLTTHYQTAKRYAKGSRKFYMITIKKGNDIKDIDIDIMKVKSFISDYVSKPKIKEIMPYIERQIKDGKINAGIFSNIMINNECIKSAYSGIFKNFLIQNGVDYEIVDNAFGWHEKMVVLFNMRLIIKKQIITPKDKIQVFDLPTGFVE